MKTIVQKHTRLGLISKKVFYQNKKSYLLAFFLPILIMLIYFIAIRAYPFGKSSIMTVDLGQQYIDFFGYFHDTILKHPSSFFYSFSKDLGGDTIGLWGYYLLSPLNLLFLFFSKPNLDVAVIIITLIKYGLMSLTFYYFNKKTTTLKNNFLLTISLSYALSGFFIANQFNLIWLDAGYILPLVALGINYIFIKKTSSLYTFSLAAILLINYYMGYMICLFSVLYFCYQASINYHTLKDLSKKIYKFIIESICAAGIAAIIILPIFFQLTQSKGTYTNKIIHIRLEYNPLKILTKFNIGAFNFDEVSQGYPNIYIPSILLALALLYFFSRKIPLKIRLTAFLITVFLFASLCFEPLDLLWHGLQFPVWYPYRFSYLVIFWLLILARDSYTKIKSFTIIQLIIPAILFVSIVYCSFYFQKKISYLNYYLIAVTALFLIISIAILGGIINNYSLSTKLFPWLICFEIVINAYVSLSMIGFISHEDYQKYLVTTGNIIKKIKHNDSKFYRIAKSFQRTNDDAMMLDFNGTDQFNSMLEPKVSHLYAKLGQPQSEGDVTYGNGNVFVDSFLGIKYYLDLKSKSSNQNNVNVYKQIGTRADVNSYGDKFNYSNIVAKENPYALSLGFLVPPTVLKNNLALVNPINNYNVIYKSFSWEKNSDSLFFPFYGYEEKKLNVKKISNSNWSTFQKINDKKPGRIIFKLKPLTDDPYYVSLNGNIGEQNIKYFINNQEIHQNSNINNTVIQSLFQNQKGKTIKYEIKFNQKEITLYDFNFYFMSTKNFLEQNASLQNKQLKISSFSSTQIIGKITVPHQNSILFLSIPAVKGWHASIDGKKQSFDTALDHFLALRLKPGSHRIQINYQPPYFKTGLTITLCSLIFQFGKMILNYKLKKYRKREFT